MTRLHNSVTSMAEWRDRKRLALMTPEWWYEMNGYNPSVTINGITQPVTNLPRQCFKRFIEICRELDKAVPHASEGIELLVVDDEADFHQVLVNAGPAQLPPERATYQHRMLTDDRLQLMLIRVEAAA